MKLEYLIFEASDDGLDQGAWEAMATVKPEQLDALRAEVAWVLAQAERRAPGPRGPEEEGGVWDALVDEWADGGWHSLTLTLTGPWAWGERLMQDWGSAAG